MKFGWIKCKVPIVLSFNVLQALVKFSVPTKTAGLGPHCGGARWYKPGEVVTITHQGFIEGTDPPVSARKLLEQGLIGPRWPLSLVWKVKPYKAGSNFDHFTVRTDQGKERVAPATPEETERFNNEVAKIGKELSLSGNAETPESLTPDDLPPIPEGLWETRPVFPMN